MLRDGWNRLEDATFVMDEPSEARRAELRAAASAFVLRSDHWYRQWAKMEDHPLHREAQCYRAILTHRENTAFGVAREVLCAFLRLERAALRYADSSGEETTLARTALRRAAFLYVAWVDASVRFEQSAPLAPLPGDLLSQDERGDVFDPFLSNFRAFPCTLTATWTGWGGWQVSLRSLACERVSWAPELPGEGLAVATWDVTHAAENDEGWRLGERNHAHASEALPMEIERVIAARLRRWPSREAIRVREST